MSHQFIQQIIHVMWSTKQQNPHISQDVASLLYKYISKVIQSKGGKLYLAGGSKDHVHCLFSLPPVLSLSSMMRFVKQSTSKWLKHQKTIPSDFYWEEGYSAFSVQNDRIEKVCNYIKDDELRHEELSYRDELAGLLVLQKIEHENQYLLSGSHSKLLIHLVWGTKNRSPFLNKIIAPETLIATQTCCKSL